MRKRQYLSLFLRCTLPTVYNWYRKYRDWYWQYREKKIAARIESIDCAFASRYGLIVQSGPFAGMVHVGHTGGGLLAPKLICCYEEELHNVLSSVLQKNYDNVVNIGCAEGYYAIGFALAIKGARVYAFDINPLRLQLCEEMARINGVADRVVVSGTCDTVRLHELTQENSLVFMDCEGCEFDLLNLDLVPGLCHSDIIVELHDGINPSISEIIHSRFLKTHDITVVNSAERDPDAYPAIQFLKAQERYLAVAERPTVMQWFFMTPKSRAT